MSTLTHTQSLTKVRKPYQRPALVPHVTGLMNKPMALRTVAPMTEIDGVPVEELVEQHGSPLFVFSQRTLIDRYAELEAAFQRHWGNVEIAWSYKTNYLDAICRVFHQQGAAADVVSEFEFDKAIGNGVPADRIYFNGPYKPDTALRKAFEGGAHVHLDNFDEIAAAERVATEMGVVPDVAIRINLTAGSIPAWTRFGFNLETGQALDAVKRLLKTRKLNLDGLHCHIGTFVLDPESYREAARKLAKFANLIRREHDITISYLDLGGGFASHNTLKGQYLTGEQVAPTFDRYAQAIARGLRDLDYAASERPTIVLETGRALVDSAGSLISTVHATKRLPDARRALVMDAGVNILFTAFWYNHAVSPAQPVLGAPEPTVMVGPLCMNIDVVRDTFEFPPLRSGERVVFRNVGAYNVTQWNQFIVYRPAVVMISADGRVGRIRRAEAMEDVAGPEEVPLWI